MLIGLIFMVALVSPTKELGCISRIRLLLCMSVVRGLVKDCF